MNFKVIYSVFKRNYFGYLANPTGYVFICVFVLLSSIAAFLPDEFFNANLANLNQLNLWFPLIMIVFVPAITMGIWADERRQGTDELLLTIPASDFDIVLGKFAAAASIYTLSLLFSMVCNFFILRYLGTPDSGLFIATYIGYWFIGISLISVGMTASFLTGNLTVAYILGAVFCSPFVALQWVDALAASDKITGVLKSFGIASQFELFGRGTVNLSSIFYFLMLTSVMLYLSMILIGRRHWTANQKAVGVFHYSVRFVSLLIIGLSLCFMFRQHDARADMTEEKLGTLSPETVKLLKELKPEYPVQIDAFISPDVPESHVQIRLDTLTVLSEIESLCGKNVAVKIHPTLPFTDQALIANQRYGIKANEVSFASRGKRDLKSVFLGLSFRCGLRSLTLPFIDRGLSAEYEIVHALSNITSPQKKRIGVLKTDAPIFGRLDMGSFQMLPSWQIVEELKKQYTVVEVDPLEPIREKYDALLAVQPSAMGPQETMNFIEAVQNGQKAIIFEDPLPVYIRSVAGTSEPRQQSSQMAMMMNRQSPKGDITPLWEFLGVEVEGANAVWQEYSPLRKLPQIPKGFVFLDRSSDAKSVKTAEPFNAAESVSASLQYMMMPFPGRIVASPALTQEAPTTLKSVPLLQTFQQPAGTVGIQQVKRGLFDGSWERACVPIKEPLHLAVRIRGEILPAPEAKPAEEKEEAKTPAKPETVKIDVILIADIDMLSDELFALRRMGNEPSAGINLDFDNVTFVLNAIDSVAGDERFLAIRNRRPKHRTLSKFDENTDAIRLETSQRRTDLQKKFDAQIEEAEKKLTEDMKQLEEKYKQGDVNEEEVQRKIFVSISAAQKQLAAAKEKQQRDLNQQLEKAEVDLNNHIQRIQGRYKLLAVLVPPIAPLLIGIIVFFIRKVRETEGIPQTRRRK